MKGWGWGALVLTSSSKLINNSQKIEPKLLKYDTGS